MKNTARMVLISGVTWMVSLLTLAASSVAQDTYQHCPRENGRFYGAPFTVQYSIPLEARPDADLSSVLFPNAAGSAAAASTGCVSNFIVGALTCVDDAMGQSMDDPGVSQGSGGNSEDDQKETTAAARTYDVLLMLRPVFVPGNPSTISVEDIAPPQMNPPADFADHEAGPVAAILKQQFNDLDTWVREVSLSEMDPVLDGDNPPVGLPAARTGLLQTGPAPELRLSMDCGSLFEAMAKRAKLQDGRERILAYIDQLENLIADQRSKSGLFGYLMDSDLVNRAERALGNEYGRLELLDALIAEKTDYIGKRGEVLSEEERRREMAAIRNDPDRLAEEEAKRRDALIAASRDTARYQMRLVEGEKAYASQLAGYDAMIKEAETRGYDDFADQLRHDKNRLENARDQWRRSANGMYEVRLREEERLRAENARDGIGPTEHASKVLRAEGKDPKEVLYAGAREDARKFVGRQAMHDAASLGGSSTEVYTAGDGIKDFAESQVEYAKNPGLFLQRYNAYGVGVGRAAKDGVKDIVGLGVAAADLAGESLESAMEDTIGVQGVLWGSDRLNSTAAVADAVSKASVYDVGDAVDNVADSVRQGFASMARRGDEGIIDAMNTTGYVTGSLLGAEEIALRGIVQAGKVVRGTDKLKDAASKAPGSAAKTQTAAATQAAPAQVSPSAAQPRSSRLADAAEGVVATAPAQRELPPTQRMDPPPAQGTAPTQRMDPAVQATAPTQRMDPPAQATAPTQRMDPPAQRTATAEPTQRELPPTQRMDSPAQATAPTQRMDPPARGTAPTQRMDPPAQATAPTQRMDPPAQATAPTQRMDPPARGTAPTQRMDPPARGTAPTQRMDPPAQATPPTQRMDPAAQATAPTQRMDPPAQRTPPTQRMDPPTQRTATAEPSAPAQRELPPTQRMDPPAQRTATAEPSAPAQRQLPPTQRMGPPAQRTPPTQRMDPPAQRTATVEPSAPAQRQLPRTQRMDPPAPDTPPTQRMDPPAQRTATAEPSAPTQRQLPRTQRMDPPAPDTPPTQRMDPPAQRTATVEPSAPAQRQVPRTQRMDPPAQGSAPVQGESPPTQRIDPPAQRVAKAEPAGTAKPRAPRDLPDLSLPEPSYLEGLTPEEAYELLIRMNREGTLDPAGHAALVRRAHGLVPTTSPGRAPDLGTVREGAPDDPGTAHVPPPRNPEGGSAGSGTVVSPRKPANRPMRDMAGQIIRDADGNELTLGEFVAEGATSAVYAHPEDPNKIIRVTNNEVRPGVFEHDNNGRKILEKLAAEGGEDFFIVPTRHGDPYRIASSSDAQLKGQLVEVIDRVDELASDQLQMVGRERAMTQAQNAAFQGVMRYLNRKGYTWLDNHAKNYGFREVPPGSGQLKVVIFDTGGIVPMKGSPLEKYKAARALQEAFDSPPAEFVDDMARLGSASTADIRDWALQRWGSKADIAERISEMNGGQLREWASGKRKVERLKQILGKERHWDKVADSELGVGVGAADISWNPAGSSSIPGMRKWGSMDPKQAEQEILKVTGRRLPPPPAE